MLAIFITLIYLINGYHDYNLDRSFDTSFLIEISDDSIYFHFPKKTHAYAYKKYGRIRYRYVANGKEIELDIHEKKKMIHISYIIPTDPLGFRRIAQHKRFRRQRVQAFFIDKIQ